MPKRKEIKIFIIEDDFVFIEILANILDSINEELKDSGVKLKYQTFYSAKEAGFELTSNPHIVLLDYYIMDDELNADTGTKILKDIKTYNPTTDVLVISGQENPEVKDELIKNGATAYIPKDADSLINLRSLLKEIILKHINLT